MTVGGVVVTFVTVTVPLAFVTTRIGATTRAVPDVRVAVDDPVAEDVDAAVVVVPACVTRNAPSVVVARVGVGVTDDVSVGVRMVVVAPVAAVVPVGPAANRPGVAVIAAVVGGAVVLVTVGVAAIAAVVGVGVTPFVASAGAVAAVPVVAPTVAAAVVPVAAPVVTPPRKMAPSDGLPPVMTGVGAELMDAFTVACGFAYADGGTNCPVACTGCGGLG
jgi:hypothetical protein